MSIEEGCCTRGATVRFDGRGHLRLHITAPDGRPVAVRISCSPRDPDRERYFIRRTGARTIRQNGIRPQPSAT